MLPPRADLEDVRFGIEKALQVRGCSVAGDRSGPGVQQRRPSSAAEVDRTGVCHEHTGVQRSPLAAAHPVLDPAVTETGVE